MSAPGKVREGDGVLVRLGTDFDIFVSTISQICQFLIFFHYNTDFAIFDYLRDWFFEDLSVTQIDPKTLLKRISMK